MNKIKNKHLLIIVETRKNANTDDTYIKETIRRFYPGPRDFIPKFIYMKSKGAFNSRDVGREIKEYVSLSNVIGIILCIDLDDYDISIDDKKLNKKIEEHCQKEHYDLVWFCKNVEDVYYFNAEIEKNKKVNKAKQFVKNKMIEGVNEANMRSETYSKRHSNILKVLDKYYK